MRPAARRDNMEYTPQRRNRHCERIRPLQLACRLSCCLHLAPPAGPAAGIGVAVLWHGLVMDLHICEQPAKVGCTCRVLFRVVVRGCTWRVLSRAVWLYAVCIGSSSSLHSLPSALWCLGSMLPTMPPAAAGKPSSAGTALRPSSSAPTSGEFFTQLFGDGRYFFLYMHTYIHADIRTCMRTYMHKCTSYRF